MGKSVVLSTFIRLITIFLYCYNKNNTIFDCLYDRNVQENRKISNLILQNFKVR